MWGIPVDRNCVQFIFLFPEPAWGLWYNKLSISVCGWMNEVNNNWVFWDWVPFFKDWSCSFINSATEWPWGTHGFEDFLGWSYSHSASWMEPSVLAVSGKMAFLWSQSPWFLYQVSGHCTGERESKGPPEWTDPFFLLCLNEMTQCSCWHHTCFPSACACLRSSHQPALT